ncbi:MAG: magnesium/cobalt transporter CorA [Victivallaceae bacterium]
MSRLVNRASVKAGLPPGTMTLVDTPRQKNIRIELIRYNQDEIQEQEVKTPEEIFQSESENMVSWINLEGLNDMDLIKQVGDHFGIHPLIQEDIVHCSQRPRYEEQENYSYIVLKMLTFNVATGRIESEQVSMILTAGHVITFQEKTGDVFDSIRKRLRTVKGKIRKCDAGYLAYSLIDAVIDNYFIILEQVGDQVDELEVGLIDNPCHEHLLTIHRLKREMIFLRRAVWPLRELISGMEKSESKLFDDSITIYLRDIYEHTIQIIDTTESLRDMLSGMLDIYLSSISNRMNEIMKVLTIISTIFIPLTFIAGIYGMNFEFMPELKWRLGYYIVLLSMASIAGALLLFFRKKRWI